MAAHCQRCQQHRLSREDATLCARRLRVTTVFRFTCVKASRVVQTAPSASLNGHAAPFVRLPSRLSAWGGAWVLACAAAPSCAFSPWSNAAPPPAALRSVSCASPAARCLPAVALSASRDAARQLVDRRSSPVDHLALYQSARPGSTGHKQGYKTGCQWVSDARSAQHSGVVWCVVSQWEQSK